VINDDDSGIGTTSLVAFNAASNVTYQIAVDGYDSSEVGDIILNLSLGGALVTARTKFAMGQRVQIEFSVPTPNHAIEIGATVRWSSAEGVGVQFDGLRARDVWALNEYFKQLSP